MREPAIPSTPNDLYDHLRSSDNPAEAAANLFEGIGFDEDVRLRFLFRALKDEGLIKVFWAESLRMQRDDEKASYIKVKGFSETFDRNLERRI